MNADKENIRKQAKLTRAMLPALSTEQQDALCVRFFDSIPLKEGACVSAYWPYQRELDTHILMEQLLEHGVTLSLPVVEEGSRVLKFAQWDEHTVMQVGAYGIPCPEVNDNTLWMEPDIMLIPMLAFDRRGYRLGYGGGYYDATLDLYRREKEVLAVGLAYVAQTCLFSLPIEDHDQKMNWIITEQSAIPF